MKRLALPTPITTMLGAVAVPRVTPARRPRPAARSFALDDQHLFRSVNSMAIPIITENLFQTMLGIVDLIMVGRLGAVAIAGVGTALQIMFIVLGALSAITIGTTVLVARFAGAEDPAQAARVVKQSLLLGVACSAIIAVVGHIVAHPVIALLGAPPAVTRAGGDYLDIVCVTSVTLVVQFVCASALRGAGDTRTSMIVTGLVNIVNIVVAYALIFGHFGLPALGVVGSAWGASAARAVGALVLLALLASGWRRVSIAGRGGWRPDAGLMRRVMRIGLPSMMEQTFMNSGMLLYSIIVIGMGTAAYAAQRITFNALNISFMPGLGFGLAATTMTSQALGAGRVDLARRSTNISFYLAALWMCTMGAALFLFGNPIMHLFSNDPTIDRIGTDALRVIALSQPFQALGQVMAGSLRGAGDTRFPMVATGLAIWLVRLPFGWLFGVPLHGGLPGVYISNVMDAVVRAAANYLRFRRGLWHKMRV